MPLRKARAPLEDQALENRVKEACSYSYDLEIVAGLYEQQKKKKSQKKDDRNNNDLQVGCFIQQFPMC